eukprot:Nitzschia sp. Nitz4//scaffold382_size14485//43//1292//NITZ4_008933-RA/size14485-snap-gene-0.12-mRNA-1//1//CDS//3329549908//6436//frame0
MKFSYWIPLTMVFGSTTSATSPRLRTQGQLEAEEQFVEWTLRHDKVYEDHSELQARLSIWLDNHAYIEQHNNQSPPPSYLLGHNQFSDMTVDEYQQYNKLGPYSPGITTGSLLRDPERSGAIPSTTSLEDLPPSVDWVTAGAVVPVKNQGMCGSCWAFSAICAIEGAHFVDTGSLVSLSEQELVDCDPLDAGCGGGLMDNAFLFDENSTGLCSEEDYPYAGHKRWFRGCAAKKGLCESVEHTRVKGFVDVDNTVEALMEALVFQPVSVGIEADQRSFQLYKSGVYDDPECGTTLDHGVAAVGYGTEDGVDYFLVRNSWGDTWGDAGYIKMARQNSGVNGTCGILTWPSRPELRDD